MLPHGPANRVNNHVQCRVQSKSQCHVRGLPLHIGFTRQTFICAPARVGKGEEKPRRAYLIIAEEFRALPVLFSLKPPRKGIIFGIHGVARCGCGRRSCAATELSQSLVVTDQCLSALPSESACPVHLLHVPLGYCGDKEKRPQSPTRSLRPIQIRFGGLQLCRPALSYTGDGPVYAGMQCRANVGRPKNWKHRV